VLGAQPAGEIAGALSAVHVKLCCRPVPSASSLTLLVRGERAGLCCRLFSYTGSPFGAIFKPATPCDWSSA
jgi:hypothetical protein